MCHLAGIPFAGIRKPSTIPGAVSGVLRGRSLV
jgi:hypothetical protein